MGSARKYGGAHGENPVDVLLESGLTLRPLGQKTLGEILACGRMSETETSLYSVGF
ncbi:MAG: hypothetical protein HXS41_09640 [Theionarchaea archaeon]|nr:hypothetical protein [Theionarchaea archaeon]MBU7021307.1 hypothetical protein [Theionarchaea archaeon]